MLDAVQKDPQDARLLFHIACAYEKMNLKEAALETFQRRVLLGGEPQEIYPCRLRSAALKEALGAAPEDVMQEYASAISLLPGRAEAYIYYADFLLRRENYTMGYLLAKQALELPFPAQIFRVDTGIYKYGRLVVLAECAWRIGRAQESYEAIEQLLAMPDLPPPIRSAFEKNSQLKVFEQYRNKGIKTCQSVL